MLSHLFTSLLTRAGRTQTGKREACLVPRLSHCMLLRSMSVFLRCHQIHHSLTDGRDNASLISITVSQEEESRRAGGAPRFKRVDGRP